ncbi:MAG: hypothetical protein KDC90_19820, partial [Ignavibacteriae bacterium]|nr:hypothetical protein [Ignavibacteriota bacterium]
MRNLIFVISILSLSLLNAQSLDEKITNLNKAKTFLGQSETQNYVSILDSVRKIIYLSDEIEKLFNNAEQNIQNNYKKLLNAEEQQRSTSSKSVHEVAIGRTIIVEGIIEDIIVSSDKAKVSVLLSDNVRCTLKNKSDIKDADQNAKVLIKGKVFSHENSSSILEDCIFFRKKDFSEQYAQAKKLLQKFVNDCLGIIDIELKQGNELLVTNLISEASREYLSNKFENALDLYLKIESIDPQFPKIQDHLLNSKMNLEYQKAAESLNNNEFFEAYILLEPLAFEYNFKNSKELYLKAFTKNYSQLITNSINRNNISTYISVFDTLNAKNKKYIDLCFDSLSAAWIKEFKNFAYAYYINNYSSYYVVPGGNYSKYHGQLIEINTFI